MKIFKIHGAYDCAMEGWEWDQIRPAIAAAESREALEGDIAKSLLAGDYKYGRLVDFQVTCENIEEVMSRIVISQVTEEEVIQKA